MNRRAGGAKAEDAGFALPVGKRRGPQNWVTINVNTAKRGSYRLLLTQSDGTAHSVPVTVLPPNPTISNLPIRFNVGEAHETIQLQGTDWIGQNPLVRMPARLPAAQPMGTVGRVM